MKPLRDRVRLNRFESTDEHFDIPVGIEDVLVIVRQDLIAEFDALVEGAVTNHLDMQTRIELRVGDRTPAMELLVSEVEFHADLGYFRQRLKLTLSSRRREVGVVCEKPEFRRKLQSRVVYRHVGLHLLRRVARSLKGERESIGTLRNLQAEIDKYLGGFPHMKTYLIYLACLVSLSVAGCNNLSPRFDPNLEQKIDNQNGRIDEIESNQNSIKNEMLNLNQRNEIIGSELDRIQMGFYNEQNNGIQILSGSGGLFLGLTGSLALLLIVMHYRQKSVMNDKIIDMLAERLAQDVVDDLVKAAMYTDVEEKVYALIKKHYRA